MDQSDDIHTKYDLIQRERICDDIWLCTTRPEEICYKPCKVHNPLACDGAGLPGVDWEDDDVFENDEEESIDTSFSADEVWDSDVDIIDHEEMPAPSAAPAPPAVSQLTPDNERVNMEMERWMQIADLFYGQPPVQDPYANTQQQQHVNPDPAMAYYPWNSIYNQTGVPSGYQPPHPMLYTPMPAPQPLPSAALNNMMNNNPWALINSSSARPPTAAPDNRGWDELIAEQERYQNEMAAAMAAQCVGATVECETISDTSATTQGFSSSQQQTSDEYWRQMQHQQHVHYVS